jgi:L-threonylcarbamoyladenylate synthase
MIKCWAERAKIDLGELSHQVRIQVERAVEILKNGGIVAFPTDTVYGLGGDVFNVKAAERIYKVKQRPSNMPLPVLLADSAGLANITADVPEIAWCLIKRFWPGGLTLVLPKKESLPDIITAGGDKVAVRIPDHAVPLNLIRGLGSPLIGTSANISREPNPLTAAEVEQQLGGKVDMIIDAGRCPGGLESTVVDVAGKAPLILRRGIISEEEIKKVCREYSMEVN